MPVVLTSYERNEDGSKKWKDMMRGTTAIIHRKSFVVLQSVMLCTKTRQSRLLMMLPNFGRGARIIGSRKTNCAIL